MNGGSGVGRNGAFAAYAAAVVLVALGAAMAGVRFPGGFDWAYTVISNLASPRHNPDGGIWLCGALLLAMILLWPAIGHLDRAGNPHDRPRAPVAALRLGLAGGVLLALEGFLILDFSSLHRKGHEALALVTMVAFYAGVLGLYGHRIRRDGSFLWPALPVVLPLLAIGLSQLTLYVGQRELGWVDSSWRELGVPLWLSFAFWQWLAVALLGTALGHLILAGDQRAASAHSATGHG